MSVWKCLGVNSKQKIRNSLSIVWFRIRTIQTTAQFHCPECVQWFNKSIITSFMGTKNLTRQLTLMILS